VRFENGESQARRDLPNSLTARQHGPVDAVTSSRPAKEMPLDDATIAGIESFFSDPPETDRAPLSCTARETIFRPVSIFGRYGYQRADQRSPFAVLVPALSTIENGRCAVVAVLHGGVIGGVLELALLHMSG